MRILLLTIDFPPSNGGVQHLLLNVATGLAAHHDVHVVTLAQDGDSEHDRDRPYRITRTWSPRAWRFNVMSLWAVSLFEVVRRRPDVIICGHVLLGTLCRAVSSVLRTPYVAMAYAYEIRAPRMRRVAGWALRGATCTVTISAFSRQAVLDLGVAPDRVFVIPPGPATPPAIASGDPAPVSASSPIVLSVSRLSESYKGHDMLIRALPLIRARVPGATCVIVGDGRLRPYLERLAVSVGVGDAVTFTGEVSDAELDGWYRRCRVFVLLSRESRVGGGSEGFGLVFVEANLRGKPVVGGRSGGVPDAVLDGVTGLLVDPRDIGEIADTITRVLQEADLAASLGAAGRQRAAGTLAWPSYIRSFEQAMGVAVGQPVPVEIA